jgi:Rps23 Pro-64 3,4-dihydroxylase Tpa1-like proline 4-hydroxylase
MTHMKTELVNLIVKRLNESKEALKKAFFQTHPIQVARHFALDNLLPNQLAEQIYAQFPKRREMRLLKSAGQLKLAYSHIKNTTDLIQDLHFAIQDPQVIAIIEGITEIKEQIPDHSTLAGGVSMLLKGHFINPHLDNSHDITRRYYRTLNSLYYVSPNWGIEHGGNYELWDEGVDEHILVPSLFNRLVVMETNRTSWHAVNPVKCDKPRCCVFNYYFSERSPEGQAYFHGPASTLRNPLFKPRPEQTLRRWAYQFKSSLLRPFKSHPPC